MQTVFRNARADEAEAVYALYRSVIGTRFCAWDETYPGLFEIRRDLAAGALFVLEEEGRIIGAISLAPENELDELSCWSAGEKAGEFARVVICPERQGKQLARLLVSHILEEMKRRGYRWAHISVASENIPAQKTYGHFGFTAVGQEEMWGHCFYLYELPLG